MPKYKRRPKIVDAEQWFPGKQIADVIEDLSTKDDDDQPCAWLMPKKDCGYQVLVLPGDWVVIEGDGRKWTYNPRNFAETFELVTGHDIDEFYRESEGEA